MLVSLGKTWEKLFGELLSSMRPLIHSLDIDVAFKMAFYILSLIRAQVLAALISKLVSEGAILGGALLKKSSILILIADISIWRYLLFLCFGNTFRMRMFMCIFLKPCFILTLFHFKIDSSLGLTNRIAQKLALICVKLLNLDVHAVQIGRM